MKLLVRSVFTFVLLCLAGTLSALAAGPDPIGTLQHRDAYLSPKLIQAGVAQKGDLQRLEAAARSARNRGVPEKFLLVSSSPYATAAETAHAVRDTLSFSGVVVVLQQNP